MAKRIQIQKEDDYHYQIIGIASDERIWKVCYEINNLLKLRLKARPLDYAIPHDDTDLSENQQILFEQMEESGGLEDSRYYEDIETNKRVEYALFVQPVRSSLPKETKPFRYFFLIRSADQSPQDTGQIINALGSSTVIRSAVDITHIKQIKKLIP